MNLLLIIAEEEYVDEIKQLLQTENYYTTEIGSNGEFLQYGEVVLMLGIKEEESDHVLKMISEYGNRHLYREDGESKIRVFSMKAKTYEKLNCNRENDDVGRQR